MQESYVVCGGNNPSDPLQHYTVLPKVLCTGGLWHLGTLDFSLTIYTKLGENRGKLFSVYFTNHIQQQGLSLQGNSWVNVNKIMTWLCDHKLSMEFPKKMQARHFHIYAVFSAHKDIMMNYRKTKFSFSPVSTKRQEQLLFRSTNCFYQTVLNLNFLEFSIEVKLKLVSF